VKQARQPAASAFVALAGFALTLGLAFLGLLLPFRHGMDASTYLAVFTVGLLITLAGIQLATPKRRAAR
jgi:hypothetical protein